jgi:hypothetical protein
VAVLSPAPVLPQGEGRAVARQAAWPVAASAWRERREIYVSPASVNHSFPAA